MRKHEPALTPEQCTLRRNAVIGELNERCRGTDINYGEWSLFVAQARTWDGLSRQPGLQQFIGMARIQPYYGKQEPPAEKMIEPDQPVPVVNAEEQQPQTEEMSTTPEQPLDSEPPQPSNQSGQDDDPPAQPVVEEQTQHDPQTQDENSAQNSRHTQPSREKADNTQSQQQAQTQTQSDSQPIQETQQPQSFNVGSAPTRFNPDGSRKERLDSAVDAENNTDPVTIDQDSEYTEATKRILSSDEMPDAEKEDHKRFLQSNEEILKTLPPEQDLDKLPERKYSIDGIVPEVGIIFINGQPKTGKTYLAASMAHAYSRGDNFAGRETQKRPVIFIELEGSLELQIRLAAITRFNGGQRFGDLMVYDKHVYPGTPEGRSNIRALLRQLKVEGRGQPIIILDNLSLMVNGDENKAADVQALTNNLNDIKNEYQALIFMISHAGKDEARGISGSNKFAGIADLVLNTRINHDKKDGKSNFVVIPSHNRGASPPVLAYTLKEIIIRPAKDGKVAKTEALVDYNDITIVDDWAETHDENGAVQSIDLSSSGQFIVTAVSMLNLQGRPATKDSVWDCLSRMIRSDSGQPLTKSQRNKCDHLVTLLAKYANKGLLDQDERGGFYVTKSNPVKWNK